MAKGVGLIAVVGGLAGGQANLRGVLSFFLAVVSVIFATVTYFYTHPRKKQ